MVTLTTTSFYLALVAIIAFLSISNGERPRFAEFSPKNISHFKNKDALEPFPMYLLAMSWQPQFCHSGRGRYPGCNNPTDFMKNHFTIHGLWPDYGNGKYPSSCGSEEFKQSVIDQIGLDKLKKYWPNVKKDENDEMYSDFWNYEWKKHGTCSGLDQFNWANSAIELLLQVGTPDLIQNNVGKTVRRSDLQKAYGGKDMAIFRCKGRYLQEVRVCFAADNGVAKGRIACDPESNCPSEISIGSF